MDHEYKKYILAPAHRLFSEYISVYHVGFNYRDEGEIASAIETVQNLSDSFLKKTRNGYTQLYKERSFSESVKAFTNAMGSIT